MNPNSVNSDGNEAKESALLKEKSSAEKIVDKSKENETISSNEERLSELANQIEAKKDEKIEGSSSSELPGSVKFGSVSGPSQQNGAEAVMEFYLTFCFDILLELLRFGDRRMLIKIQGVGRQFHVMGEKYFPITPFLRLNLRLDPSETFKVFIGADYIGLDYDVPTEEISPLHLAQFPPFLRFDNVKLPFYGVGYSRSNDERCQLFDACLQPIKDALFETNHIDFFATINQANESHFSDHQALLDYLAGRLLPIFGSARSYKFSVWFFSDGNSIGKFIDSILRMPHVSRCSNVVIQPLTSFNPISLPMETISNWLNRNVDASQKQQKDIFLRISHCHYQNVSELWALLKMKFKESKLPALPFTLKLKSDHIGDIFRFTLGIANVEDQSVTNEATNEQLSISKEIIQIENEANQGLGLDVIEVKRARMEKKKKKNAQAK